MDLKDIRGDGLECIYQAEVRNKWLGHVKMMIGTEMQIIS